MQQKISVLRHMQQEYSTVYYNLVVGYAYLILFYFMVFNNMLFTKKFLGG